MPQSPLESEGKLRYLSLFTGIGGFELGIQQAYEIGSVGRAEKLLSGLSEAPHCPSQGNNKNDENNPHRECMEGSVGDGVQRRGDLPDTLRQGNGEDRRERPDCIGFSEIDKYAVQIYQKHFPEHKNYGDITKINEEELPDFDLLCGGFPCQAFSIAGKRGGFSDTRGTLFFDIARILKAKQPKLLLLENVKGLLSHDEGRTFATIISTLDELGYDLQWQVLNSKNHGVPQNRERVFIIGHLRGTSRPEVFPIRGDDPEDTQTSIPSPQEAKGIATRHLDRNGGLISNEASTIQVAEVPHVLTNIESSQQEGNQPDDSNVIRRATYSDDMRIRRLTPTECERLQGFPDGWTEGVSDTQRYKCLGNAVTVNVIRDILNQLPQ